MAVQKSELAEALNVLKAAKPMLDFMYVMSVKRDLEKLEGRRISLDEFGELLLSAQAEIEAS